MAMVPLLLYAGCAPLVRDDVSAVITRVGKAWPEDRARVLLDGLTDPEMGLLDARCAAALHVPPNASDASRRAAYAAALDGPCTPPCAGDVIPALASLRPAQAQARVLAACDRVGSDPLFGAASLSPVRPFMDPVAYLAMRTAADPAVDAVVGSPAYDTLQVLASSIAAGLLAPPERDAATPESPTARSTPPSPGREADATAHARSAKAATCFPADAPPHVTVRLAVNADGVLARALPDAAGGDAHCWDVTFGRALFPGRGAFTVLDVTVPNPGRPLPADGAPTP